MNSAADGAERSSLLIPEKFRNVLAQLHDRSDKDDADDKGNPDITDKPDEPKPE